MLKQRDVDAEEERLRELAYTLPDEQRKAFFQDAKRELRDPDTYAALNWFFLTGLHHFYLKRWLHGFLDLVIFLVGLLLIIVGQVGFGALIILVVSILEMWALIRAQIIVQDWNNKIYRRLLSRHGVPEASLDAGS